MNDRDILDLVRKVRHDAELEEKRAQVLDAIGQMDGEPRIRWHSVGGATWTDSGPGAWSQFAEKVHDMFENRSGLTSLMNKAASDET